LTLMEGSTKGVCEGGTNHHFFVPAIWRNLLV
jgi:hypothetical protein